MRRGLLQFSRGIDLASDGFTQSKMDAQLSAKAEYRSSAPFEPLKKPFIST